MLDIDVEVGVEVRGAVEELHSRGSRYEGASETLQLAETENLCRSEVAGEQPVYAESVLHVLLDVGFSSFACSRVPQQLARR